MLHHIGNLPQKLAQHNHTIYDYVDCPPVSYPELADEMWCHRYYLRNLCNTERFGDWNIVDHVPFLQARLSDRQSSWWTCLLPTHLVSCAACASCAILSCLAARALWIILPVFPPFSHHLLSVYIYVNSKGVVPIHLQGSLQAAAHFENLEVLPNLLATGGVKYYRILLCSRELFVTYIQR